MDKVDEACASGVRLVAGRFRLAHQDVGERIGGLCHLVTGECQVLSELADAEAEGRVLGAQRLERGDRVAADRRLVGKLLRVFDASGSLEDTELGGELVDGVVESAILLAERDVDDLELAVERGLRDDAGGL